MDSAEVIKACLERGILVSSEELKLIEEGRLNVEDLAQKAQPQPDEKTGRITTRLKKPKVAKEITPANVIEQRKNNYEAAKKILLSKASAMSIGNARDSSSVVSLIGSAKQVSKESFVLEDTTGEIEVSYEGSDVENGDIVCVKGTIRNGRVACKEVVFPDISLFRPIGKMQANLLILPKEKVEVAADVILSTKPVETDAKNIVFDESPAELNIYKDEGKVSVLFFKNGSEISQQEAINMLKKRLIKNKSFLGDFFIETLPDVFWISGAGTEWIKTHKGVTIVCSSEKPALIDLSTREAKLI